MTDNGNVETGYYSDDGNAEVHYPDAKTREEAAQQYAEEGDWGDRKETTHLTIYTWPASDPDDRQRHTITLLPIEPGCDGGEHDWCSPHEVVGGCDGNPGVGGHGGGVVITEVCRYCRMYRITDTWAQDPNTGEQGLRSVEYEAADDDSRAWVEEVE